VRRPLPVDQHCHHQHCRFHPSGDPSPSPEDVKLTKDAAQAAEILGIDLLDHVIIGDGRFVSLKEQGAM
jgi:DNA repair protein RadC